MKILNIVILASLFSVCALAKKIEKPFGDKLFLVSKMGQIDLVNSKNKVKTIESLDDAMLAIKSPSIFKDFVSAFSGEKVLAIKIGDDQFDFFIPRKHIDKRGEFTIHQKYTKQKYHVQYARVIKDHSSIESQKKVSCSWETSDTYPQYSTDSDGNSTVTYVTNYTTHWGEQQAIVNDQVWNEKQTVVIYDEKNQLRAETAFAGKSSSTIVRELTTCR